jgi:hypothetical protein
MEILEPLTSEADELILRGATSDEDISLLPGEYSKVKFGGDGQIIAADLASW